MPVFIRDVVFDTMIEFKDISKQYELKGQTLRALNRINLQIPTGSIFGIIGYSGAGKSTLIRLINLLERPTSGQVIINGTNFTALDAKSLRQERTQIGMIFQHFNLMQTKTVAANIEMPMKLLGWSKAEREKRLEELLDFIDLKHKRHAFPDELSGGQKQRVGIARALANHPKFCCVMKQLLLSIRKRLNLYCNYSNGLIRNKALPLLWSPMKWM